MNIKLQWPIRIQKRQTQEPFLNNPSEWQPFTSNFPPTKSSQLASVGRCLRLYSDFMGEIPIVSTPKNHYLLSVLKSPNPFMSKQNLFESLCFELLLNGNFMAHTEYNSRGEVTQIHPYRSGQCYAYPVDGEYSDAIELSNRGYYYRDFKGRVFVPSQIWHIKDSMFSSGDNLNGLSRVYLYQLAFDSGANLAQTENSLSSTNLKPPWLLSGLPEAGAQEIEDTRETIKTFFKKGAQGVLTVPAGFDLKSLMIESPGPILKYLGSKSDIEISRIFSVPLQLLSRSDGETKGSAQDLKEATRFYIKSSLKAVLKNISDSLERLAMDGTEFKFEIDRFRASDLREQSQYISQLVTSEVLSKEEAKELL